MDELPPLALRLTVRCLVDPHFTFFATLDRTVTHF
jgi:hypothetical protein